MIDPPIYKQAFRVVQGAASRRADDADLTIIAPERPREVEAAIAYVAFVPKLVCLDWSDVLEIASEGVGLSRLIPGVFGVAAPTIEARTDLTAQGFGDGFLLVQMVSTRDFRGYSLQQLDDFAVAVMGPVPGPCAVTAGYDYWRSFTLLIGFRHGLAREGQ